MNIDCIAMGKSRKRLIENYTQFKYLLLFLTNEVQADALQRAPQIVCIPKLKSNVQKNHANRMFPVIIIKLWIW